VKPFTFGSLDFIADYFGGPSLSPRRDGLDATFMGSNCSGLPYSPRAMIGDSTKKFLMASGGEGGSGFPSPRRHDTGASPALVVTSSWLESTPTTQAMIMVPP
jgi:hypothetical protein